MKIYIAGPMTGICRFNEAEFYKAEQMLADMGHEPMNPHRMDKEAGFDLDAEIRRVLKPLYKGQEIVLQDVWKWVEPYLMEKFDLMQAIRRDTEAVLYVDALYMLNGWEYSRGATAEFHLSVWAKKQRFYQSILEL